MALISIDQILRWNPCAVYDSREKIIERTDGNWPKTPLEILDLDIPAEDRLWVLLRPKIIPKKKLHLLACDFAEDVLFIFEEQSPQDNRLRCAIEAKRRWVNGEISDKELFAAWGAADAVVRGADIGTVLDVALAARASAGIAVWVAWVAWVAWASAAKAVVKNTYMDKVKQILIDMESE